MKPELLEILVCPTCKGSFELKANKTNEGNIVSGSLICTNCDSEYVIENSIPNLMPYKN